VAARLLTPAIRVKGMVIHRTTPDKVAAIRIKAVVHLLIPAPADKGAVVHLRTPAIRVRVAATRLLIRGKAAVHQTIPVRVVATPVKVAVIRGKAGADNPPPLQPDKADNEQRRVILLAVFV